MRVVILAGEQPNQIALCQKLAARCELVAIVFSRNIPRKQKPLSERLKLLLNRLWVRVAGQTLVRAWREMQSRYARQYAFPPNVPITRVSNVNDAAVLQTIEASGANLVAVSGTNLVGRKVIELSWRRSGIVNLHTGISPYVKGGPNCTNWCLAERWFHLIGSSVLWLDPGIDTGPIIATEQTPLSGQESLDQLHWAVMEHAHQMYVDVIDAIGAGREVPRVPQASIAAGQTLFSSEWNGLQATKAWLNYKRYFGPALLRSGEFAALSQSLKLFPRNSWLSDKRSSLPTKITSSDA
jgi:methionyl-tRNA formyltransferase